MLMREVPAALECGMNGCRLESNAHNVAASPSHWGSLLGTFLLQLLLESIMFSYQPSFGCAWGST